MSGHPITPEPLPQDPDFYRRVLHYLPTPVVVIDEVGTIRYANRSVGEITGTLPGDGVGMNMVDHIHPDDVDFAVEAITRAIASGVSDSLDSARVWGGVTFRLLTSEGEELPLLVSGIGGLTDEHVGGIIAHLHPAWNDDQLRRVLTGLARGDAVDDLMAAIVNKTTLPGLELEAAAFEWTPDGDVRCVSASDPALAELPVHTVASGSWPIGVSQPERLDIDTLPDDVRRMLAAEGYQDYFEGCVDAPDGSSKMILVGCSPLSNLLTMAATQRMERSLELTAVVLMRAHIDQMLAHAATHDDLTGLPNRLGLANHFEELSQQRISSTLMFVDMDGFKAINDQYGHHVGDIVLSEVAQRLRLAVRSSDHVARLGGDEFAVLVESPRDAIGEYATEGVANRIIKLLSDPIEAAGLELRISASVGIADSMEEATLDALLGQADQAMYAAKNSGGGAFRTAGCTYI